MWIRVIPKDTDSSVQLHDPRGPHAIPHEIPWDSRSPSVALQPQWLRDPWDPENPKTLSTPDLRTQTMQVSLNLHHPIHNQIETVQNNEAHTLGGEFDHLRDPIRGHTVPHDSQFHTR